MKKELCLLAAAALLSLGALPRAGEPESLKPVSVLAVDGGEILTVTAVSAGEEPEVLKGTGASLTEALADLRENSARRAFLGQTQQLLLGEGTESGKVLELIKHGGELRADTLLYIVGGPAGPALEQSAGRTGGERGGRDPRAVTVGELLPRLAAGEYGAVPLLVPDEKGELVPGGWAVLGPGGAAGRLEGEAALGCDMLKGAVRNRAAALPSGEAELLRARWGVRGGELRCTLTARPARGSPREEELAAWGESAVKAALAAGWDCWGLGRRALRPARWGAGGKVNIKDIKVTAAGRLTGGYGQ